MVTNNSMMRDSAGASPVPDKERNPSMRSKALGGLLAAALSLSPAVAIGVQTAYAAGGDTAATEYTLYPKPHSIRYDSGQYILRDINVIYDDDIDEATQDRLDEVAALKNLNVTESDAAVSGKTNVYVGVNGSDGKAETATKAVRPFRHLRTRRPHTSSSPTTARSPCSAKTPTPASTA